MREYLTSLNVDGVECVTWKECASKLMEKFFPAAGMNVEGCSEDETEGMKDKSFEWNEVEKAIVKAKLRKAPGLDGVNAEILRAIWRANPGWVVSMFDACLRDGCFPSEGKKARVVILPKSPEKPRSDPASYRPISLLPVLGKTLERLMIGRLECRMKDRMNDAQHGFRRGRSTESAWAKVKEYVRSSECKYVLGVFVDFKGAFDNLEWKRVLERMSEIGCEEMALWKSYFQGRRACMIGVNEVVWRNVERGCPQGSICGPFIWNLMMDVLLWKLDECGCKCVAYADDLLLIVEGQSRVEVERMGTDWMRIVYEWGENIGVSVSDSKTVTMLMKGSMAESRRQIVRINGKVIKYVECVKYLGVWVSERMHFKVNLDRMKTKVTNVVGQLRRVLKCEWGMRKRAVRIVCKGLFVACVMYGSSVCCESMKSKYARDIMNRCQRIVLYACLKVCKTVSTASMQVIMGAMPWDLECMRRGLVCMIKNGWSLCKNELVTDEDLIGRSLEEKVCLVNERVYARWQTRWDECVHGRVTYEYIKDVRFGENSAWFDPSVYACYLLTGHGSMNAFLCERNLSESAACVCGAQREDWKHVLVECSLYDDLRDLGECGVCVSEDGSVNVSRALECKEKYESFCMYAMNVFVRRRMNVRCA